MNTVQLTLETGATSNMIRASSPYLYVFPVTSTSQIAPKLDALVVRQLDADILAGNPFMVRNDIGSPCRRQE